MRSARRRKQKARSAQPSREWPNNLPTFPGMNQEAAESLEIELSDLVDPERLERENDREWRRLAEEIAAWRTRT